MASNPTEFLSRTGYREVHAAASSVLTPGATINGVLFTGAVGITVAAAAGTLTGTTLNSTVVSSSLTSVGTLANLTVTNPINGSITGNAATVTTNANLTGPITSIGNVTSIASSIALPGSPTTTTQTAHDNSTKIATTAYVDAASTAPGGSTTQIQYNNSSAFGGAAKATIDAGGNINLGEYSSTDPATPAAGNTIFSRNRTGRRTPAFTSPDGLVSELQRALYSKHVTMAMAQGPTSSNILYFGRGNYSTASVSNVSYGTGSKLAASRRVGLPASSAGQYATVYSGSKEAIWRGNGAGLGGFFEVFRFGIEGGQAGTGFFVGVFDTPNGFNPIANNDVTFASLGGTGFFGVGCDAGDSNVHFLCMGASARTYTDLGSNFPATTTGAFYELRVWCEPDDSSMYWSLERLDSAQFTEGSSSTNLPSNSVFMGEVVNFRYGSASNPGELSFNFIYTETYY